MYLPTLLASFLILSCISIETLAFTHSRGSASLIPSFSSQVVSKHRLFSTAGNDQEETTKVERTPKSNLSGHDVKSSVKMDMDPEELALQQTLVEHQTNAAKLGFPVDVRTLVQYNHGFAVISTNSKSNPGFPGGSVVGFAPDEQGRPLFIFSRISAHTQDIMRDPKCSLTIASKDFKGAADGRVNLLGEAKKLPKEDIEHAKEIYRKKHPGAFWVDFGDFKWFRMEVQDVRFVGGFARAGSISSDEYTNSEPDAISEFGGKIAEHMNGDHMSATIGIVSHYIPGLVVTEAEITSVDSLGMYIKCTRIPRASNQPQQFKIRMPFPRRAENRGDVKGLIVEMTQAAAKDASESTEQ